MVRILPETVRKGERRMEALTLMSDGRSRWEYPTTFLMEHPAGFWQSIAVPRLEEKVPRSTWQTFLGLRPKRPTEGGNEEELGDTQDAQAVRLPNSECPAGHPLTDAEHRACRNRRHKSTSDGRYRFWDFSSHAGCRRPADSCPRGKREIIKVQGLHPLILMQLPRRGGHLAGKKIQPRNVNGHVQALRRQLIAKDLDKDKVKRVKKEKAG